MLCRALKDSGNLLGTAISSELAKRLKLPLNRTNSRVGTADRTNSVQVVGRAKKPFNICLENMKGSVKIRPYVLKNLSHPINIGQNFLQYHQCDLYFRERTGCTALCSEKKPLICPSTDVRLQRVLAKWEKDGGNPPNTFIGWSREVNPGTREHPPLDRVNAVVDVLISSRRNRKKHGPNLLSKNYTWTTL